MGNKDTTLKHTCVDTTLDAGGVGGVAPVFPGDVNTPSEQAFWDSIATEPAQLSGTPVRIYSVRRAKNRHPLYAEPSRAGNEWEYHGPWEIMGAFAFDQGTDIDDSVGAEGIQKTAEAVLHLSRKALEDVDAPDPKVGDVIHLWDRQPFGSELQYWDVVKANPDGNVFTHESFVQFRLELRHRSRFEPGRKVEGKRI